MAISSDLAKDLSLDSGESSNESFFSVINCIYIDINLNKMDSLVLTQIFGLLDQPHSSKPEISERARNDLLSAGYGNSVVNFVAGLCSVADGATLCQGAFRVHPFDGVPEEGLPGMVAWNQSQGWKTFEPRKDYDTFYFASNSFGDLFGLPLNPEREIARERVGILWTERYEYQEAGIPCPAFLLSIQRNNEIGEYFARIPTHDLVARHLGLPTISRCFSSNVPPILGGPETIENISIQSLTVHVSFTLQVLQKHLASGLKPGTPLPMTDLYDQEGNPLA